MECAICKNWCRDGSAPITEHDKKCPNYNLENESLELVKLLINGMERWGSDEDGIHKDAWEAYLKALVFVGNLNGLRNAIKSAE